MLFVLAMIAVVVGVDVLFFRRHFWERRIVGSGPGRAGAAEEKA